jgi:hypothetical protein
MKIEAVFTAKERHMSEKHFKETMALMTDLISTMQDLSSTVSRVITQLEQVSTRAPEAYRLGIVESELASLKRRVSELLEGGNKVA